jgi:hypothetical protein
MHSNTQQCTTNADYHDDGGLTLLPAHTQATSGVAGAAHPGRVLSWSVSNGDNFIPQSTVAVKVLSEEEFAKLKIKLAGDILSVNPVHFLIALFVLNTTGLRLLVLTTIGLRLLMLDAVRLRLLVWIYWGGVGSVLVRWHPTLPKPSFGCDI